MASNLLCPMYGKLRVDNEGASSVSQSPALRNRTVEQQHDDGHVPCAGYKWWTKAETLQKAP